MSFLDPPLWCLEHHQEPWWLPDSLPCGLPIVLFHCRDRVTDMRKELLISLSFSFSKCSVSISCVSATVAHNSESNSDGNKCMAAQATLASQARKVSSLHHTIPIKSAISRLLVLGNLCTCEAQILPEHPQYPVWGAWLWVGSERGSRRAR